MYGDITFNFVGTCVQDREFFTMEGGQQRAAINIAVNVPRKNRDTGEYDQSTTWVRVAVFGDRASSASVDRCRKGMPVYVRGTLQSYSQEIAGRNYTFYNFRPDVIRPLLSLDQLARVKVGAGAESGLDTDAPSSDEVTRRAAVPSTVGVPSAESDYFND